MRDGTAPETGQMRESTLMFGRVVARVLSRGHIGDHDLKSGH